MTMRSSAISRALRTLPFVMPTPPPTTYAAAGEVTSPKFATAFSRGCEGRLSGNLAKLSDGDFAAFCTPAVWPLLDHAIQQGRNYYYGDHGFYARGRMFRIAKNGVQYQPSVEAIESATKDRFLRCSMNATDQWKRDGRHILICPNSDMYHSRYGRTAASWVSGVVQQLERVTDRPIVIRSKGHNGGRSIFEDLHDCWMTIVFSSNAGIDALRSGVPICVTSPWAATASMGIRDVTRVETPYYPDQRIPFLWALADAQWSLNEIGAGDAWRWLCTQPDQRDRDYV